MRVAVLVASLAWPVLTPAGTIEVLVHERDGGPLAHEKVYLYRADPAGAVQSAARPWESAAKAVSDERGLAVFSHVAPGSYYVGAESSRDPSLILSPTASSSATRAATIIGDDDLARLEIVYERGVWITAQVVLGRQPQPPDGPPWVVRQESPETGEQRSTPIRRKDGHADFVLPTGRWVVYLDPFPGLILVGLEADGILLGGHTVELNLTKSSAKHFVQWTLSAPCTVRGKVRSDEGRISNVRIEAELVEPGPWFETARRRQGSVFDRGSADLDLSAEYRMMLPSGRWRLRPVGDGLLGSDPESVDLSLADGDDATADFMVTEEPLARGSIYVEVVSPDGRRVDDATVELWRAGERAPEDKPVQTGKLLPLHALVPFIGVPAGSYRVAAGRLGYVESEEEVSDYEPGPDRPRRVRVRLREGATIVARATDPDGKAAPGAVLRMERIEPFISHILLDGDLAAAQSQREATTDATSRTQAGGFHAGRYRLDAALEGSRRNSSFVELRGPGGAWGKTIEVDVADGGRMEVELRIVPAARIKGRLACEDRGPIPRMAAVVVLPSAVEATAAPDEAARDGGEGLVADRALLTGEARDTLVAGPLEEGAYRIAVKPGGYDRWTWAPDGEDSCDASIVPVERGAEKDLGSITVLCGPGVEIVPAIRSKQPIPDLTYGRALAVVKLKATDVPATAPREIAAKATSNLFSVRELPEGEVDLEVTVHHPYFLPGGDAHGVFPLKLERGHVVPVVVVVQAIGGAVRVRGAGAAARLVPAEGEPRLASIVATGAVFEAVSPAAYRVDLCADPACAKVSRSWKDVAVTAAATVELGTP